MHMSNNQSAESFFKKEHQRVEKVIEKTDALRETETHKVSTHSTTTTILNKVHTH